MKTQAIDSQLVKLQEYQKKNRLRGEEMAELLGISRGMLYKLYNSERSITTEMYTRIEKIISEGQIDSAKTYTENYAEQRISTLEEDMVKSLELIGETPEFQIYKKVEYLKELTIMREKGALTEEEFIKIKTKLIAMM